MVIEKSAVLIYIPIHDKTPPAHAGSFSLNLWEISSMSMGTCHLPPPALSGGQIFHEVYSFE